MEMKNFQGMDADELRQYIQFLLWHYRVVDAFGFLYVSEGFDQATAERINEKVWGRVAGMAAKDLKSRFNIQEKGLDGFVKDQNLYPFNRVHVRKAGWTGLDSKGALIRGSGSSPFRRQAKESSMCTNLSAR